MTESKSTSALVKRAEQLKRWEESDTNKYSSLPKTPARIRFASGIVFLAACSAGDKEEVQRLLNLGADINTVNIDGLTALHQACIDDNLEMVEFLVTNGADINRGDNEGWTPLHATSSCGFLSIARYLLDNNANVASVNCDGQLPIDIAESEEMSKLLEDAIKERGVDCAKYRNAELNMLLDHAREWAENGYCDVRDQKTGGTPLHVAAAKGYISVAKILLEHCYVDPDTTDFEGWTPLHAAALWGQKTAAALLLTFNANPHLKNYAGQSCMDIVDSSMKSWLQEEVAKVPRILKSMNSHKRKLSPPLHDLKRVDIEIVEQTLSDEDMSPKSEQDRPPASRARSPDKSESNDDVAGSDAGPSWRRPASFKSRRREPNNEDSENTNPVSEVVLKRAQSFESDNTFHKPSDIQDKNEEGKTAPNPPASKDRLKPTERSDKEDEGVRNSLSSSNSTSPISTNHNPKVPVWSSENVESNSSNSTQSSTTPTRLSPGNIFKNFFKTFGYPVRDEESETQRKAHAKRVRETRRSTQGVTLEDVRSAEQLFKKKSGDETTDSSASADSKKTTAVPSTALTDTNSARGTSIGDVAVTLALARATATATATIAANSERRPSWRLRLDPANKFELEETNPTSRRTGTAVEPTVSYQYRRPSSNPPVGNTTTTKSNNDDTTASTDDKENNSDPKLPSATLNVIQRRRRPKRRSTGVGHAEIEEAVNDSNTGDIVNDAENIEVSGGEGTKIQDVDDNDYKILYQASLKEVRRIEALLAASQQQLREAQATIAHLKATTEGALSETEKREKRAMERKLSEMEEELKSLQALQAENQQLKDENGALVRVISKLSK